MNNAVLNTVLDDCAEMLYEVKAKIPLEEIAVHKRFQFAGDYKRVREVVLVDGEFVLIRTLGCMSDTKFYKVHYSHLIPNETPLNYLK